MVNWNAVIVRMRLLPASVISSSSSNANSFPNTTGIHISIPVVSGLMIAVAVLSTKLT